MPNEQPPATIEDALRTQCLPSLLDRFVVKDLTCHLNPCAGQVIMLFESPHFTEVLAGHPLAGKSGQTVFKAFLYADSRRSVPLYCRRSFAL